MTKPKVSILIPVYNCESTLGRALESLANQTYRDFEVVIVDNNCTDGSMNIASYFKKYMTIKTMICKEQGIVPAMNTGLRSCSGEWIARQDGDDYWYPDKLQKQIQFLEDNPHIGILGTQIRLLDEDGNVEENGTYGLKVKYPTSDEHIKIGFMYGQNMICHPSVIFHRRLIDLLGGYEQLFPLAEDLHLWLRAFPHFQFANLGEVLVDYTQKKSAAYDARVPVVLSDMYYNLYKASGLITGEREELIWDWQRTPGGHKHNVDK